MKKIKQIIALGMASAMLINGTFVTYATEDSSSVSVDLTSQQRNAVNMLNYISELFQEIRESSNSKLFLEEAYASLINNTEPSAVDPQTLDEVLFLLDILEGYRMLEVKRERLQYIYEQNQAQALRDAIPNPLGVISLTNAFDPVRIVTSIVYMAVDSVASYESGMASADLEYLKENWDLDDKEKEALHKSKKDLYTYMVNMVNAYKIDGEFALSEEAIDEFVEMKNVDNLQRRIQFLESKRDVYKAFGPYWITLVNSYYEDGNYQKCLNAMDEYEGLQVEIFRKDYEYAETLPLAITAAREIMEQNDYVKIAKRYCDAILQNSKDEQWSIRYFVAETLCDLYSITSDESYLEEAYEIALNNTNYLLDEQKNLTQVYINDVVEVDTPKGATKERKEEIKQYNKMLKSNRKKELAPIYEPLLINCELFFSIANELNIPDSEKNRVEQMLRGSNDRLFPVIPIDSLYRFTTEDVTEIPEPEIIFKGDEIDVPVEYVTNASKISTTISTSSKAAVYDEWKLSEVRRKDKNVLGSYYAIFKSKEAKDITFDDGNTAVVKIVVREDCNIPPIRQTFKATTKKAADFLDKWKWLDSASSFTDSVEFERVEK